MITPFQQRVYDAIEKIPKGRVTTYKDLARYLKCNSCQAIGQALKKNPFAPRVPCHRVITSQLTLGGYSGETSGPKAAKKRNLLKSEGITFSNGVLEDSSKLFRF